MSGEVTWEQGTLIPTPDHLLFTIPQDLTAETASLTLQGKHRVWTIRARQGTATVDKWTVTAEPIPSGVRNEASGIEDGQFPSLQIAYEAYLHAEQIDNGTSEEG